MTRRPEGSSAPVEPVTAAPGDRRSVWLRLRRAVFIRVDPWLN